MSKPTSSQQLYSQCLYYALLSLLSAFVYLYMATSMTVPAFMHFFYPFTSVAFGALAVYTERLYGLHLELKA